MYRTILMLTLAVLVIVACGSAVSMPSASPEQSALAAPSTPPTSAPVTTAPASAPAASSTVDASPSPAGAEAQIDIANFMFDPNGLQVPAGTTVRWTNADAAGHTVTSGPSDEPDGMFDSGVLEQGDAFSFQFMEPGTYEFYCDLHPRMTGQIEVGP